MDPIAILLIFAALILGIAIGWLAFGRGGARLAAERDDFREKAGKALADLARAALRAEQADALDRSLAEARGSRDEAVTELARTRASAEERDRAFAAQLTQLREMEAKVQERFGALAASALNDAQALFLKRAEERFQQAGEKSEGQLKALLTPVEATLKRYEEGLGRVEKERVGSYEALREAVGLLHAGHAQVRDETARLVNALRSSPKARGRWGEQSLKNVLEQAGLSPFADFQTEVSVEGAEGRLRPDVVVRLPGGRKLIVDAKCSLNAFLDASEAIDDVTRTAHLKSHAGSIRTHAQQLGSKAYWEQFGEAADYVVMYIPGEHFLTAALEQDEGLWEWAFQRRVLLATPTNLVAIARTVASVWRQERLAEEAAQIAEVGKELYKRLATMGDHVARVGKNLAQATGAYNSLVGSLESQVLTQAKRFEALKVETGGRAIEALPMVEASVRPLTKLAAE